LICLTENQTKQAIVTDTLLKLYKVQLINSDSIIDLQRGQLAAKDTVIDLRTKQRDLWHEFGLECEKALNECQTGLKRQRLSTRIWQGVAAVFGVVAVVK